MIFREIPAVIAAITIIFSSAPFFHALAQDATIVQTAILPVSCLQEPAKLSDEAIGKFLQSPLALLSDETSGAAMTSITLASRVRALAASSSNSLDMVLKLVESASDTQIAAIGAGLSRAAQACVKDQPDYAAVIQSKVAEINNQTLLAAFAGASEQLLTASLGGGTTGGAAGASAAGIGGAGVAGGGTAGLGGDEGTAQSVETYQNGYRSRNYYATERSLSPSLP